MSLEPIFDTALARHHLARAGRMAQAGRPADFLLERAVDDLVDRLQNVQRSFTRIADLATPTAALAGALARRYPEASILRGAPQREGRGFGPGGGLVVGDAERSPLAPGRFDLVATALALHGANDLPGALVQARRALVPDGLFLAALPGGRTLHELRAVLTEAEATLSGGASPRVYPFADVRDMGGLMQRAGFALPVAASEQIVVRYPDLFALMADLRAMGAASALAARSRRPAPRALFAEAARLYAARFADADGRIRATFEFVSVSGWAPDASQQAPARRGSGRVSLAQALGDRSGRLG